MHLSIKLRAVRWISAGVLLLALGSGSHARGQGQLFKVTDPTNTLIPQCLLPCIHAAEVQAELGLTPEEVTKVEAILKDLDLRWLPGRNLDTAERRALIGELETELLRKLAYVLSPAKLQRLQQLELQVQGPRLMLRPDVATRLGVSAEIQQRFREFAERAEKSLLEVNNADLSENRGEDVSKKTAGIKKKEIESGYALLNDKQKQALSTALGKQLDYSKMERIYPIAPELVDSNNWSGTPTRLADLRGKVVIVHFYAFQCINCRNNFRRYNEWAEKFKDQDVAIVGIQTPETAAEADPALVIEAALRDKFQFPVLIDLGQKNWKAWGNSMWPTVYVIDKQGYIRMWWQGELNWQGATGDQQIADAVNRLLKE